MTFSHPWWLPGGLIACLWLIWLWRRYDARQQAALAKFVSAHLRAQLTQSVSIGRRRAQRGLLLVALAFLFTALAGPQLGYHWEQTSRRGNEIIFAVDTSRSMSTPDVKPDRLTRAKLAIDDFTDRLDGDAVGLVAFAGSAFLVCPVTLDYGAFHESLNALDTGTIPRGGTDIASAIREAQTALRRHPDSDKILVLVTDGEDLEGNALAAAQAAAQHDGLKIFTIGVGTANGDLIPVSPNQAGGFVKDASGAFVKSKLDEPALKAIAAATGALYAPLGAQSQGLETIYKLGLAAMVKHDLASHQQKIYTQRYQWPLAAALAALLGSLLIGNRRRRARLPVPSPTIEAAAEPAESSQAAPAVTALSILLLFALLPIHSLRAEPPKPEDAYKKGDFVAAEQAYGAAAQHDLKNPVLPFNAGTAAYRAGQFPQAAQAFQDSISRVPSSDSKRLAEQQDAYYNLGNTLYRTGQKTEESAPQETIQRWTQAVKAYETALQLRADDADSKFNRDFVKRKIDALKNKQSQKNPPQDPQKNPQQNQQPQNQQQNQQQDKQQQNQQNQQQQQQKSPQNDQKQGQQPPNPQQSNQQPKGGESPPDQQPPNQKGQPPPSSAGQSPPPPAQPKDQPPGSGNPDPGEADRTADGQRLPGQMSREEARQLLDSVKGEERHPPGAPLARADSRDPPPDPPRRDW